MTGFADMMVLGFLIGLTGALAPGPTLVAAIDASARGGWTAGPKVTFGHMAVETVIILMVVAGLSVVLAGYTTPIAVIGGIALMVFGILTLRGAKEAAIDVTAGEAKGTAPVLAGLVTSISNPYFWIWWLSVGSALLVGAMQGGIIAMLAFIAGHWSADLGWYTLVSVSIHKGRFFLSTRQYRIVLAACGLFLVGFGLYYLLTAFP